MNLTLDDKIKNILNHIHAGVLYCVNDPHSTILYANDYFYTMIGYTKEEVEKLFNNHFADMVIDDVSEILVNIADSVAKGEDLDYEYRMRKKDGSMIWIHDTAKYDKEANCWYVTIMDITEMKSLEYERQKLNTYLNNMPNKIIISDVDDHIVYKNNKAQECTYYNQDKKHLGELIDDHILGTNYSNIYNKVQKGDKTKYETRYIDKGKLLGHDKNYLIPIRDKNNNILNYMQVSEDLLAQSDVLTKFPTRAMLEHYFQTFNQMNPNSSIHICIIDIDNFKSINDTYGHIVGDHAIRISAKRITEFMEHNDYVCRFGGDEFIVLFMDQSLDTVMKKCNKLIQYSRKPIKLDNHEFYLTYSIGLALSKPGHHDYEDIFQKADYALYEVKSQGKGHILLYNEACSLD